MIRETKSMASSHLHNLAQNLIMVKKIITLCPTIVLIWVGIKWKNEKFVIKSKRGKKNPGIYDFIQSHSRKFIFLTHHWSEKYNFSLSIVSTHRQHLFKPALLEVFWLYLYHFTVHVKFLMFSGHFDRHHCLLI